MQPPNPIEFGETEPSTGRRRKISLSDDVEITQKNYGQSSSLCLICPIHDSIHLAEWVSSRRSLVESLLLKHGSILFRGFLPVDSHGLARLITTVSGPPMEYVYRSTPRSEVVQGIYTSTEYPPHQHIPLHNEMAYSEVWPKKIWFACLRAADRGGETSIADSREVLSRISPEIVEEFRRKGVMYVRNYIDGLDLTWRTVFQTDSRERVEEFCRDAGIQWQWKGNDRLRTWQVCSAVQDHPDTGQEVWFNQAHLFHITALAPEIRGALTSIVGEENLPRNALYGDGSPIDAEALESVRAAYRENMDEVSWKNSDVLLLDNMLAAHGRAAFEGCRKVIVGMAEPVQAGRQMPSSP